MPRKSNYSPKSRDEDPLYRYFAFAGVRPRHPTGAPCPTDGLTEQQMRVFALLSEGISNKQIARRLDISESTVKVYVSAILRALGCDNRTQAALAALRFRYGLPTDNKTVPASAPIDKQRIHVAS